MAQETNPGTDHRDDPADAARLHEYAVALADGVERALGPWVIRTVDRILDAWTIDHVLADGAREAAGVEAEAAAERCVAEIAPAVRRLLLADIDDQRANPLAIVRRAVAYPTAVLHAAGVASVSRDAQAMQHFPDDAYDITPASFADLDPALHDLGLEWGAAKAHVHLRRRRADGQR